MENKIRKILSVFCVLAMVITAFAAVGRNVKAEIETQTEYTEEEIENQFLGLLTMAGFNAYVSVQEDVNGNYKISFGSDNPGYYECTLTPTQVDYFMESSDNINPMLGKEQNINEGFERDFLNPFVATDGNIHIVWQEKADDNFEIFYTNDESKQYENTLIQVREKLDPDSTQLSKNMDKAIEFCLEGDYKHSIVWVHKSIKILEKTENTETINTLIDSVMDFAKTNILYAEYDLTFNNTYIQEAYDKYYLAVDKYEKGNYDAAVEQFKNSYLKIVEAYEEKDEIFTGVDFGETVRISYTDYDSVAPEVFLNGLISISWMEVLPEENHVYYARSSNNGVSWWYFDATEHAGLYLTYWGMSSSILTPRSLISIGIALLLLLLILIILALIIILIKCHFFYGILIDRTYGPIDDPYLNIFSPYDTVSIGDNIFNTPRTCGSGPDPDPDPDPEPAPDLTMTSIYFSDTYVLQGDPTTVYATIKNQGTATMSGTIYAKFKYGTSYDTGATIGEVQIPPPLYAGYSTTVDVSWTPTNTGASFDTTVWVMADSRGGVTEGNEGNNIGSVSCHIFNPDKDDDVDGLTNWDEVKTYGTDPYNSDTDHDMMSDLYEVRCGVDVGGWQDPNAYNDRYAVLIARRTAGDAKYDEFWNDLKIMYDILKNDYGYIDDNSAGFDPETDHIAVLYDDGNDVKTGKYGTPTDITITDLSATTNNINTVFSSLHSAMDIYDFLFVWTFDHGGYIDSNNNGRADLGEPATLCTQDGSIQDSSFATQLERYDYTKRVFVMQQCFGGGFIYDLSNGQTVTATAARGDEEAHGADTENEVEGGTTYHHGEFLYYFQSALNWETPQGTAVNADSDGNGYISILEAFNYVKANENAPETPQLDDDGNGQSQQNNDNDDGKYAGSTFL